MGRVGLRLVGVMSFVAESDVRTDWLSGAEATMMDVVVRLVVLWDSRVFQAVEILSLAFQSSSCG